MTETDIQRYAREVAAVDLDHERNQYTTTLEYRLAQEVVRLQAILAMLRKPDLDVLASAMTAWSRTGDVPAMLHAALTTAEQTTPPHA